jgi:hypothetical protein
MRDIGVFTAKTVPTEQLIAFVRSYALRVGLPFEKRQDESVVGHPPDVLYVFDTTTASNGYFSKAEKEAIESKLTSTVQSYLSVHFASTDVAFNLANDLASELSRKWKGIIDYSGTGGALGDPPPRPEGGASGG